MRSTTSKLIFVAVAFAAVFARGADAAADAACDTALSTAYSNVVTNSDCVASDAGVCPSTCKTALQAAEDACKDKNGPTTPIARLRSGTTTRSPGTYTRLTPVAPSP